MQRDDLPVLKEIMGKPIDPIEVRVILSIRKVNMLFGKRFYYLLISHPFLISDSRITPHSRADRDVCLPSSPSDSLEPHCRSKYSRLSHNYFTD